MQLEPGNVVERYLIEGRLGHGTFATVYRARHQLLGTAHALKVLELDHPKIRERFLLEGRVQAALRHPHIAAVTGLVEVEDALVLVLDLVEGPTLEELLAKGPLPADQLDLLACGLLEGVAHAHRAGLVHRDLKPQNVLVEVTPQGLVPKVTDFGLAKVLESQEPLPYATRAGAQLGSPPYMAPEQMRDAKSVDARADVFALGAVLYEMVAGRRAFPQEDVVELYRAIGKGTFDPLDDVAPAAPERMRRAVEKALRVDPAERYPDAGALLRAWRGDGEPSAGGGPRESDERTVPPTEREPATVPAPVARHDGRREAPTRGWSRWVVALLGGTNALFVVVVVPLAFALGLWIGWSVAPGTPEPTRPVDLAEGGRVPAVLEEDAAAVLGVGALEPPEALERAQLAVEQQRWEEALLDAALAEEQEAQLPGALGWWTEARILELRAEARTGLYRASVPPDPRLLDEAVGAWETFRAHAATHPAPEIVVRAEGELAELRALRPASRKPEPLVAPGTGPSTPVGLCTPVPTKVTLTSARGEATVLPGRVPSGTYSIEARFGASAVAAGTVRVGKVALRLRCDAGTRRCTASESCPPRP